LTFELLGASEARPRFVSIALRRRPAQEFDDDGVRAFCGAIVTDPDGRQHRQLAECAIELIAADFRANLCGFEDTADHVRFGRVARSVHELHAPIVVTRCGACQSKRWRTLVG
jgi:hypothetical protein